MRHDIPVGIHIIDLSCFWARKSRQCQRVVKTKVYVWGFCGRPLGGMYVPTAHCRISLPSADCDYRCDCCRPLSSPFPDPVSLFVVSRTSFLLCSQRIPTSTYFLLSYRSESQSHTRGEAERSGLFHNFVRPPLVESRDRNTHAVLAYSQTAPQRATALALRIRPQAAAGATMRTRCTSLMLACVSIAGRATLSGAGPLIINNVDTPQRLAIVVPAYRGGDLARAASSLERWPTHCSPITLQNVDVVLYYADGEEDASDVVTAAETVAESAGRCFSKIRAVSVRLDEEVSTGAI